MCLWSHQQVFGVLYEMTMDYLHKSKDKVEWYITLYIVYKHSLDQF